MEINSNDDESLIEKQFLYKRRYYTVIIFAIFLFYGAAYNIWGPSWNSLATLFGTDQEAMSYASSLFALGYFAGSMTCVFIFRHFNRQLSITFYLLLMCACIGFTPLLQSIQYFYIFAFLFGISEGGVDTGANSWLLEMWSDDNHMLMQALYFFFGVGTFLSPMITFSYLSNENTNDVSTVITNGNLSGISINRMSVQGSIESDISTPYFIVAVFLLMIACLNLIFYILLRYHPQQDALILRLKKDHQAVSLYQQSQEHSATYDDDHEKKRIMIVRKKKRTNSDVENYGTLACDMKTPILEDDPLIGWNRSLIILVGIGATILCFYDGFENITFEYFASFLIYSPFTCSEATAARMASLMSGSFTVVRGLAIIAVKWFTPKSFIIIDTMLMFTGVTLVYYSMDSLNIDMETNLTLIFGVLLWGAGMATFLPALYSYLEEHIRMTDKVCSILHLSCAIATPFEPILVGKFLATLPEILLYVCYASLAITAAAFSLFECVKTFT